MDILGVGPLELIFILLLALIILGPKDMVKSGRTIGRFLRKIVTSPSWNAVQKASREVRNLPNRLIREAGIEEIQDQLPTSAQIAEEFNLKTIGEELSVDLDSETKNGEPKVSEPEVEDGLDKVSDITAWTTSPDTLESSPESSNTE